MNKFTLASTIAAAAAAGFLTVSSCRAETEATQPRERPAQQHQQPAKHENLEHSMETLQRNLDKLEKQLNDPAKKEDSLKLVAQMEQAALQAKNSPPRARGAAQPDRTEYRAMMIGVVRSLLDLEENLVQGNTSKAAEAIQTLKDQRRVGHEEFRRNKKD